MADAEAFIDALPRSEIWCPSTNPADIREALRYAALIGASAADPEQAWRRLIQHEDTRGGDFPLGPVPGPYIFEVTARFLFQAYHRNNPDGAIATLRQRPVGLDHIVAPAWAVVLSRADDAQSREAIFREMPERMRISPVVLAGLAEADLQEAWQRIKEIPMAREGRNTDVSRQYVSGYWIMHGAYHHPDKTLRFLAPLDHNDEIKSLISTCFDVMGNRHPAYVTRIMEVMQDHLDQFQVETFVAMFKEGRPAWPILDEAPPLSSDERVSIFTNALKDSTLPDAFKAKLLMALGKG